MNIVESRGNSVGSLSKVQVVFYLTVSILINAIGNGITVWINLGSAFWTATSVNVSHLIHVDISLILTALGFMVILINSLLLREFKVKRVLNNILFMVPFSFLVGIFSKIFSVIPIANTPFIIKLLLDLLGIVFIGIGVSIYQRVNVLLHPNDDCMQILRFKYCHGNAAIAMWLSYLPGIIILAVTVTMTKTIYAINIGTIVSLLFQGTIVGLADKCIFPRLKHQNNPTLDWNR